VGPLQFLSLFPSLTHSTTRSCLCFPTSRRRAKCGPLCSDQSRIPFFKMTFLAPFDFADSENLHRADSAITLTNSNDPTPRSSRETSVDREKMTAKAFTPPSPRHGLRRTKDYFYDELVTSWSSSIIIVCFFTSGLIDSVAFNSWNCFVGMQTGTWCWDIVNTLPTLA